MKYHIQTYQILHLSLLAQAVGVAVSCRSSGWQAMTLVSTIAVAIFFLSVIYVSHRTGAWIKQFFCEKLL